MSITNLNSEAGPKCKCNEYEEIIAEKNIVWKTLHKDSIMLTHAIAFNSNLFSSPWIYKELYPGSTAKETDVKRFHDHPGPQRPRSLLHRWGAFETRECKSHRHFWAPSLSGSGMPPTSLPGRHGHILRVPFTAAGQSIPVSQARHPEKPVCHSRNVKWFIICMLPSAWSRYLNSVSSVSW